MVLHNILKTFPGSQDGSTTETFHEGTKRELSDYLAGAIDKSWAEPVIKNKAVVSDGSQTGKIKTKAKSK